MADRVLPLVRAMAAGREADAALFVTSSGHRLHSTAFKRTLGWSTLAADPGWSTLADGRRIHDLRLTAACLWLERGVDPGTVQAWMGHASIATTNLYLHHLGTPATGPDWSVSTLGGRRGHRSGGGIRMTKDEPRPTSRVCAGQTGFPSGGAEGIRTPDLLIANETRYQLRHSPSMRTKL